MRNKLQMLMSEAPRFRDKVRLFLQTRWHLPSSIAVLAFIVAMALRFTPETLMIGRVLYCCNIVYWYVMSLDLLSVSKYLGVYITMMAKMVKI